MVTGQQVFILVKDRKTNEPVAFANVCFEGIKGGKQSYGMTDINGKVLNTVKEKSKIAISYVGYVTCRDTISPRQSLKIQLSLPF